MKTKTEYSKELYTQYLMWKNYTGALKKDYESKMKVTDVMLRATVK